MRLLPVDQSRPCRWSSRTVQGEEAVMSLRPVATCMVLAASPILAFDIAWAQLGRTSVVPAQDAVNLDMLDVTASGMPAQRGLNLATPDRSASRLGLTPLQTPASIDVIFSEVLRECGQFTVNEAVPQNGVGIVSTASPGSGNSAFSSRGFVGTNSAMSLYDGGRLYSMTKSALLASTRRMARDLGPHDLTTNLVQRGGTGTDMNPADGAQSNGVRALPPLGRYGTPEDVTAAVTFLASPAARQITGSVYIVDGGLNA